MKKLFYFFTALAVFALACNTSTNTELNNTKITHSTKTGAAKTMATLNIDGMMCATACGGKIRKEIDGLEGVKLTTIDFEDNRDINQAIVEFDPSVLDESKLIETVNTIADGKLYVVKEMEVVTFEPGSEKESESNKEESNFDVQSVFQYPNIFNLLEKLIR